MTKNLSDVKKELKNRDGLEKCAGQFGVVGNLTRLKICYLLCQYPKLSVNEIAEIVGVSPSAVSHSLSKLKVINLVEARREGQTIYYSLSKSPFNEVLKSQIL